LHEIPVLNIKKTSTFVSRDKTDRHHFAVNMLNQRVSEEETMKF